MAEKVNNNLPETDKRIKQVLPGEFRSVLCLEDIREDIAFGEYYPMAVPSGGTERVLVLADMPIKTPYMRKYFGLKIKGLSDPLLKQAVSEFLYFNPGIDMEGIRKMTTFFVRYLILKSPIITFETVLPVIEGVIRNPVKIHLLADTVVLFQRGSLIPAAERKTMSLQTRSLRNSKLTGEIIHNATQTVIETIPPALVVTQRKVLEESKNQGKHIKSKHTMNKHIKPETKMLMDEANLGRYFRTEKSLQKYRKFLALPAMSMDRYAAELGVSKTTVAKFIEIHDETQVQAPEK